MDRFFLATSGAVYGKDFAGDLTFITAVKHA